MARWLRALGLAMGIACVAIGVLHIALGTASVPGEGAAGATVDSRERFYGVIFLGYGVAWLWAVRQVPIPLAAIRWLAGLLLAGGVARLLSVAVHGWPQAFQVVLLVVELLLPLAVFGLVGAEERARRLDGAAASAAISGDAPARRASRRGSR